MKAHNAGRQHGRMVRRRLGRDVRGWKRREQALVRNVWRAWRRWREGRIERAKQWVERWMPESVGDGWEPASWARSGEVAMRWWRKGQGWSPTKHAHFRRLEHQHEKRVEWWEVERAVENVRDARARMKEDRRMLAEERAELEHVQDEQYGRWVREEGQWRELMRREEERRLVREVRWMEDEMRYWEEGDEWMFIQEEEEIMVLLRVLQWWVWCCLRAWRGACSEEV